MPASVVGGQPVECKSGLDSTAVGCLTNPDNVTGLVWRNGWS